MASQPNPTPEIVIDIDAVRQRLVQYKAARSYSWSQLKSLTGVPDSTLSLFASGKYTGDNAKIAATVANWFAANAAQDMISATLRVCEPSFQYTAAAAQVMATLRWGQRGNIVVIATAPGWGKTSALRQYQVDTPQVWLATMKPSTRGVSTMLAAILKSMGERDAKGSPYQLSQRIADHMRGTKGLLIIDEAQHLSEQALEELRGLHDDTGIGIAIVGNIGVMARLEGGSRREAFAQLFSRVSLPLIENHSKPDDAVLITHAWGVVTPEIDKFVRQLAIKPGGLRGVTKTIELADTLAAGDGTPLDIGHMRDAWAKISSRPLGGH